MSAPLRPPSMSGSSTSTARETPTSIPAHNGEKPSPPLRSRSKRDITTPHAPQKRKNDHSDDDKPKGPPEDIRHYLPTLVGRFVGYRPPGQKPPFTPLPLPPFSWLSKIPLKYENYLWSTIGSFVGILLIEIVMIRAFADTPGNGLIVAAFGAGAVLAYSQFESPLAQPRSILGGSLISCIIAVGLTRLFRLSGRYGATSDLTGGELGMVGWINGGLSMSLALLAMQLTGTTHPPGGAAALVAATQGGAITQSWRYIYIVMVSACLELGWALVWNNLGRRRYPTYWISPESTWGARMFRKLRGIPETAPREADEKANDDHGHHGTHNNNSDHTSSSHRDTNPDENEDNRRYVINTEQRLGMGEGAGLRPDRERRLVEEGIFKVQPQVGR